MLYTEFNGLKLRLTTRDIIDLEKTLGKNPIYVFMNEANNNTPTVEEMVEIFHASLKTYHPELTKDNCFEKLDEWIEEGHIINEFVAVITELFQCSGLFARKKKKTEKN